MSDFSKTNISRDYDYYNRWTFLFPLYSLVFIFGTSILAVLFRIVLNRENLKKPYTDLNKKRTCLRLFVSGLVDVMLRTSNFLLFEFEYEKIKKPSKKSTNKDSYEYQLHKNKESYEYRLHGVPVHLFVLQYLFIMLLSVLAVSVLSFWNVFFAESTLDECNELIDCFPMYRDNSTPIHVNPITNCDEHTVNEDVTIICFQVVYKYSEGLGEAGGFLFSMQVIINIVIYVVVSLFRAVLKVMKIVRKRRKHRRNSNTLILSNNSLTEAEHSATIEMSENFPISPNNSPRERTATMEMRENFLLPCSIKGLTIAITSIMYLIIIIFLPVWVLHEREDFLATIYTMQRKIQLATYGYTILQVLLVPLIIGCGVFTKRTYRRINITPPDQKSEESQNNNMGITQNPNFEASQEEIQTSGEIEQQGEANETTADTNETTDHGNETIQTMQMRLQTMEMRLQTMETRLQTDHANETTDHANETVDHAN